MLVLTTAAVFVVAAAGALFLGLAVDGLKASAVRRDVAQAQETARAAQLESLVLLTNGTIPTSSNYSAYSSSAPKSFAKGAGTYGYYYTVAPLSSTKFQVDAHGLAPDPVVSGDKNTCWLEGLTRQNPGPQPPPPASLPGTFTLSYGGSSTGAIKSSTTGNAPAVNGIGAGGTLPGVAVDAAMNGSPATNGVSSFTTTSVKPFADQLVAALDALTPSTDLGSSTLSTATVSSPGNGSPFLTAGKVVGGGPWGAPGSASDIIVVVRPPGPNPPALPIFNTNSAAFYGLMYIDLSNVTQGTWPGGNIMVDQSAGFKGTLVVNGPQIPLTGTVIQSQSAGWAGSVVVRLNAAQPSTATLNLVDDQSTGVVYNPGNVAASLGALTTALGSTGASYTIVATQQRQ